MNWYALGALCTLAMTLGVFAGYFYRRGTGDAQTRLASHAAETLGAATLAKLEMLAADYHNHVASDAAFFAEIRTQIEFHGQGQIMSEARLVKAIDDLGTSFEHLASDVRSGVAQMGGRIDRLLQDARSRG